MADSGTYGPEVVARRFAMAKALLDDPKQPIRHWAEGLNELAKGALGGYQFKRAENEEKAGSASVASAMADLLRGGAGGQQPVAAPMAAPSSVAPPSGASPDATGAAPFRNFTIGDVQGAVSGDKPDVPANWTQADIDRTRGVSPILLSTAARAAAAGGVPFTPGAMGGVRDQATQDRLVAQGRSQTHNSNHLTGNAVDLWPEGNPNAPTDKYAQVASALKTAAAQGGVPLGWGGDWKGAWDKPHFEIKRGAPVQTASAGPVSDAPAPGIAAVAGALGPTQSAAGAPAPDVPPPVPQQVAQNAPVPTAGPQGSVAERVAAMLRSPDPYVRRAAISMAGPLVQKMVEGENPSFGFQTLPDGTIIRTDPKKGTVFPVYQAATKPTFGQVGEDATGGKQYGFIDPNKRSIEPYKPPGSGQPAVIKDANGNSLVVPEGQDPKKFREHVTANTADAMSGKLTEAQTNATQFANRMEDAEKNLAPVVSQAGGVSGAAQQVLGKTPIIGSSMQTKDYQKFEQAKSQFITAMLRKESGAAISKSEFERYEKEFFPMPGDASEVIAQKANARKVAVEAMKKGAGPMYKSPDGATVPAAPATNSASDPLGIR